MAIGKTENTTQSLSSSGLTRGSIGKSTGSPIETFGDDSQVSSFKIAAASPPKGQDADALNAQAQRFADSNLLVGAVDSSVELGLGRYTHADIDRRVDELTSRDSRIRSAAWYFFEEYMNLEILVEEKFFTSDHVSKILGNLEKRNVPDRDLTNMFFRRYLILLIRHKLFTSDHCDKIIGYLKNSDADIYFAVSAFFKQNLPTLIQYKLFTSEHCDKMFANLVNSYSHVKFGMFKEHFSLLIKFKIFNAVANLERVLINHMPSDVHPATIEFLANHLDELIEDYPFTPRYYNKIVATLGRTTGQDRYPTINFFRNQLPLLIANKLFTADDCSKIIESIGNGDDATLVVHVLAFLDSRLPQLIENNFFTSRNLRRLVANFEGVDWKNLRFIRDLKLNFESLFDTHLPLLVERGLLRPDIVAMLALSAPAVIAKYFHTLKSAGLMGRETLTEILKRADCPEDLLAPLLNALTADAGWMDSAVRWRDLVNIVSDGDKGDVFYSILKRSINMGGGSLSSEDLTSFMSLLKLADMMEITGMLGLFKEHARRAEVKLIFAQTAERLGVTNDARYVAALAKVNGEGGVKLLIDWTLQGMDRVWAGYMPTNDEWANKKTKKLFLNFLEREAKREFPSLIRLATKRGWQMIEQNFSERLVAGAPDDETVRMRAFYKRPEWMKLKSTQLYWMLISASRFMEPAGMASMRRLILGLKVENKELVYPRYEELTGVVSDEFLAKWRNEYVVKLEELGELDAESGRKAMKAQVLAQVGGHMGLKEGVDKSKIPEAILDLPARVAKWHTEFSRSDSLNGEFLREAGQLRNIFEAHYGEIRAHYGDTFAGIRTDLINFMAGMEKGVRVAKRSEQFEVSGKIEKIARSGSEPVTTCQTFEYAWVNQAGQPLHRMMHGQFSVANWIMDGTVVARRLIEVTVDDEGHEHLLVERLYTSGGFGRVNEFRAEIIKYARTLGISEAHVHFADEEATVQTAPLPIATGDLIYRDTFRVEGKTHEQIRGQRQEARSKKKQRDERRVTKRQGQGTRHTEFGTGDRGLGTAGIGVPYPVSRVPSSVSAVDLSKDKRLLDARLPNGSAKPSTALLNQRREGARRTSDPSTGSGRSTRSTTGVIVRGARMVYPMTTP